MAHTGARALTGTYGTRYRVGSAPEILYEAAGGSDDWAKGKNIHTESFCKFHIKYLQQPSTLFQSSFWQTRGD